ncbi:MAG TPA: hypothetical protein VKP59_04790 [Candidatus Thermoplasmatota archaeon]|nr:hypothetical protein [Candidatus Thermoplasmatota archaeon]
MKRRIHLMSMGLILILLLSFFSQVISVEQINETVIYVNDDNISGPWDGSINNPYRCIQDGIDAAHDGDMVYVLTGRYHEHLLVNKSIEADQQPHHLQ